jgi:hypothetical protein
VNHLGVGGALCKCGQRIVVQTIKWCSPKHLPITVVSCFVGPFFWKVFWPMHVFESVMSHVNNSINCTNNGWDSSGHADLVLYCLIQGSDARFATTPVSLVSLDHILVFFSLDRS